MSSQHRIGNFDPAYNSCQLQAVWSMVKHIWMVTFADPYDRNKALCRV